MNYRLGTFNQLWMKWGFSFLAFILSTSCSNPHSEITPVDLTPFLSQKKYAEAEAFINQELIKHPNHQGLLYNLAVLQRMQEKFQEAEKSALRAKSLDSKNDDIRLLLMEIALDQGRPDAAWDEFQNLSEAGKHHSRAQSALGLIYAGRKNWREAESCFRVAQRLGDASAAGKAHLAYVVIKQGRIEEAKAYLLEAETQSNHDTDTVRQIAECNLELGNAQKAKELAQTLIRDFPNRARLWALMGRAEMVLLNFSEAESAFTRALASNDAGPWILVDYAAMLFAAQREDEALAKAVEAETKLTQQKLPIRNPSLYNLLATLYARKGQYILAHKYLQQSLKIDPNQTRVQELIKKLVSPEPQPTASSIQSQPTVFQPTPSSTPASQ